MNREEALEDFKSKIQSQLALVESNLMKHYCSLENWFQENIRIGILHLCHEVTEPVKYFQISLMRTLMGENTFMIMLSTCNEEYFLDKNAIRNTFDGSDIFQPLTDFREELYGRISPYMGKVEKFDVDRIIMQEAIAFFKGLAERYRWYFQDFFEWDGICEMPKNSKLIIKWGEHRDYSETIYLTGIYQKNQQEFVECNQNNVIAKWDAQYVYQSLDDAVMKDLVMEKKNFMFLGLRNGRLEQSVWEGCMLYGAGFRKSVFEDVTFAGCDLSKSDFKGTELNEVRFVQCILNGADFRGVLLDKTSFEGCTMADALFSREALACSGLDAQQLQQVKIEEAPYVFSNGRG